MTTWREWAWRVIAEVKRQHPTATRTELRALLRAAYPFGARRMHPYRVWLECVAEAVGKKPRARQAPETPLFDSGEEE